VFQNPFKAILFDETSYFLELVRCIHLNPLRAGIVADMNELAVYPWTNHSGVLCAHVCDWQQSNYLATVTAGLQTARSAYGQALQKELESE